MIALLVTTLWLAAGALALAHLLRLRGLDLCELLSLPVAIGLSGLLLASALPLLPSPWSIVLLLAFLILLPFYLYRDYRRRLEEISARYAAESGDAGDDPVDDASELASAIEADEEDPASGVAGGEPRGQADARDPWPLGPKPSGLRVAALALLLILAGWLRLAHLGYAEFQGDEARAMLMAHEIGRSNDPEALLRHKKGPAEVLLPSAGLRLGDLSEGGARLPFALAGLAAVLLVWALGARLFGSRAGWLAALLVALDGYLVAFSRIVQYQSVVLLFSVAAVWCAWRFHRRARDGDRCLILAGLLLGLGSWAHYEMIFAAPPVAWLVLSRAWREGWSARRWLRQAGPPLALAAIVCGSFYLPFALHEQFGQTWTYIAERRVGGGMPYNMLGDWFTRASFYNASYYVAGIALVLVAVVVSRLAAAWGRAGRALGGLWLLGLAVVVLRPEWLEIGPAEADPPRSLALLVFLPVLAALLAAPGLDARWRMLLLWLAGPFLAAAFLVQKPHTHFYTMMPAWLLLCGWGLDRAVTWLEARAGQRDGRRIALAAGSAILVVFVLHQHVVFVRHDPEYKRVWPEARLPGYWQPFESLPRGGYFGFPYRAGWSTLREIYRAGLISGSYDSNEESLITGWYSFGAPRCPIDPDYYLVAWRPQDVEDVPEEIIERDYHRSWVITVNGRPKLEVYQREPTSGEAITIEDDGSIRDWLDEWEDIVSDTAEDFRAPPSALDLRRADDSIAVAAALELPLVEDRREWIFDDSIRLVGLDYPLQSEAYGAPIGDSMANADQDVESLADGQATAPGGGPVAAIPEQRPSLGAAGLGLTFVWQALAPIETNYSVFVHLVDEAGNTVAQSDGWPDCGRAPTASWGRDEDGNFQTDPAAFVYDPHRLMMSTDQAVDGLPEGIYTVRAGLYDPATGQRLPARPMDEAEAGAADAIELWRFRIVDVEP